MLKKILQVWSSEEKVWALDINLEVTSIYKHLVLGWNDKSHTMTNSPRDKGYKEKIGKKTGLARIGKETR